MSATVFGEALALNTLLANGYVSLHTGPPTSANEIVGNGYVRRPLGAYTITPSNPSEAKNDTIIEWPIASADWAAGVAISHFAIADAATAGNYTVDGPMQTAKPVFLGDIARIEVGELIIRCT